MACGETHEAKKRVSDSENVKQVTHWSRRVRATASLVALALLAPLLSTALVLGDIEPAGAAIPLINQTLIVPLPEAQLLASFDDLSGGDADSSVTNVVSIISTQDGAIIEYDHWEDGYEADPVNPVQFSTEVWGDQDASNGCAGARLNPPRSGEHSVDVLAELGYTEEDIEKLIDRGAVAGEEP